MKDSEYILRNEPMNATFPDEIIIANEDEDMEADFYFPNKLPADFEDLRSHLRMCERLLQLPAAHLSGPDRYTVEMAMDNPDSYQRQFVEKLYAAREREAHLRCEDWKGGEA